MSLPAKGSQISFSQLQTEFGGSNPISLSEYYGSGYPVWPTTGVPYYTSGWPNGDASAAVTVPHSGESQPLSRYYSSGKLYEIGYVVVGGGGGGGSGWPDNIGGGGGGGGGGGVTWGAFNITLKGLSILCNIGYGGAGASYPTAVATSGQSSTMSYSSKQYSLLTVTANGGNGGYGRVNDSNNLRGGTGGAGSYNGNVGGAWGGYAGGSNGQGAGGGGGGTDDSNNTTGVGGNGVSFNVIPFTVGGGGGGGGDYSYGAAGGAGGGGHGGSGSDSVTAGTDGLGGGGGGGSSTGGGSWGPGAKGGNGCVWIYYPSTYGQILTGGSVSTHNPAYGTVPQYYVHRMTTDTVLTAA